MTTTTDNLTIHYPARWAAEGGPGVSLPNIDPTTLIDDTSGAMALVFHDDVWKIVDSQGAVHAEAKNPGKLATWLSEYAKALGGMYERGELG